MSSESRLTRRTIGRRADDTNVDRQDAGDGSQLTKVMSALAVGLGVYGAYRKGWLKPVVKAGTEMLETIAHSSTDKAYQISTVLRNWTKDVAHSPIDSMFRRSSLDNLKAVTDALRDTSANRSAQLKAMIDDSIDDLKNLKDMLDNVDLSAVDRRLNYNNTTLARTLSEMRAVNREMLTNYGGDISKLTNAQREMFSEMMVNKKTYLSLEDEVMQMRRNGMRNLTLKDVFDKPFYDDEGNLILKAKDGFEGFLDDSNFSKNGLEQLKDFMIGGQRSQYRFISGRDVTSGIGDWDTFGRLKVDAHMYIDETGRLVDTRISHDMIRDFKRSLANDFVIPGLQFNPIATLTGWGRSNQDSMFGMIDKDSMQPFITKIAGRVRASADLNDEHGFFAGDKLFRFDGNVPEKIGEGFEFYNVSAADSFGLNRRLKGTAKIADLDTPEFVKKSNIKHEEFTDKVYKNLKLSREVKTKEKFNPDGTRVINSNPLIDDMDDESVSFIVHPFLAAEKKFIEPFFEKKSPYDMSINIKPSNIYASHLKATVNDITMDEWPARQFVAVKKGTSLKDIAEGEGITGRLSFIKDVFNETFRGGRYSDGSLQNFTTNTVSAYNLFDSVMDRLGNIAPMLRFENKDKGNIWQYFTNVMAYRVAPIWLALQVPGMVNAMSEPVFGVLGFNRKAKKEDKYNDNHMNLGKFIMGGVKQIDMGFHNVKDAVGLTNIFKAVEEYLPAADQINELPGIYQLGLGQTKEERQEYIEKGFDPVRKARWWSMGNCVIPEQDIQCGYGITKKAKDIKIGDFVITHEGVLKPVLNIFVRYMNENEYTPEIELHTTIFNNITTDNHPYLAVKKKLCPTSSYACCRPDRNSKHVCDKQVYKLCKDRYKWNPEWIYARDLHEGDFLAYPRIKILDTDKSINGLPANSEIGYALGLFLAEGNIHTWHKNGKTYGIELTLNNSEMNIAEKFKHILNKYFPGTNTNITFKSNRCNGVLKIRNLSSKVSEWFRSVLYPEYKGDKIFVPDIYKYNKKFILSLITGLFDGDGHYSYKNNSLQLAYTSHRVNYVIQVRNLLFSLGYANSIVHCNKKYNGKEYTGYRLFITGDDAILLNNELDLYKTKGMIFNRSFNVSKYIYIDDKYVYIQIKSINDCGYKGVVYDYEIKDSHSFCSLSTIMHNTAFTGGKINYWRPNIYRRVEADVDFSDSKWGSRMEYYSNTWLPNPVNPLAPLNKLLNPNHYDYKHYHDRPYLMTAPLGENVPIVGPLIAGTVGQVTQHKMHPEYWDNGHPVEKHDETPPELAEAQYNSAWTGEYDLTPGPIQSGGGGIAGVAMDMSARINVPELKSRPGAFILRKINEFLNAEQLAQETIMIQDLQNARKQMQRGSVSVHDILNEQIPIAKTRSIGGTVNASILPSVTDNRFSTYTTQFQYQYQGNEPGQYELYTTPSGGIGVVDVPADVDLWTANVAVSNYSISKLYGTKQRVAVNDPNRYEPQLQDYSNVNINNRFLYQMGEEFNTLTDLAGMKGYEFRTFVTGSANQRAKQLETSSYAYSFNKSFWDENLGGLLGMGEGGEETSELFRRFVQRRNSQTEYINPVRNTMPSWMPGRSYFTDFLHGDPYGLIENGEERLPGEGYERLYGINQEKLFNLSIGSSYIGKTKDEMVKHLLGDKEIDVDSLEIPSKFTGRGDSAAIAGTKLHEKIERSWVDMGLAISTEGEFYDEKHNIKGFYDALIHDPMSRTGRAIVDIKTVNDEKFQSVIQSGQPLYEHQSQVNYYLYATGNRFSNGYVYYVNRDDPTQRTTVGFRYNPELLRENLTTLQEARNTIYEGLQKGTIGRGELYSNLDRYRILADVAPYSDEFKDAKAALSFEDLTAEEQEEVSAIGERVTEQKKPLRLYPYKFKNAKDTVTETVRVKEIIDNNHILVNQYGVDHSISLAGVRVSQSNTDMFDEERTMNEAAREELEKYFRKGQKIQITYDARENKKFNKDTTSSIKASIVSRGTNVNRRMINKGLGKEKDDEGPAAMRAKYNNSQLAVGSALETITHTFAQIPFIGNKWLQAKSPYEQYRDREVYGKDFQSWDTPVKDFLVPEIDKQASMGPIGGFLRGAFIGSLFGNPKSMYGKIVGTAVGGIIGFGAGLNAALHSNGDRKWRPQRRKQQEELNEYYDTLKYVKNMGLYEKYKQKAWREDHYDIDDIVNAKDIQGVENKNRSQELNDFKRVVKLNWKHRDEYPFKYGLPKYVDLHNMSQKEVISGINAELKEIQNDRSVDTVPENAVRAIYYKQQAEKTMYGYEEGDPLQNLLSALPKKERQYFKYLADAPRKERKKILQIAPSYLRRALQQQYGMEVDKKPALTEYFKTHGLPDASWAGWDEDTDMEDVKVKLVHQEKLDRGEFDIWDDGIKKANSVNIPVPQMHSRNNPGTVQAKLRQILTKQGFDDVVVSPWYGRNNNFDIYEAQEDKIGRAIEDMDFQ